MSLISELLADDEIGPYISSLTAIPSSGGRFEVEVNNELVFSKKALGRHADPGEIRNLVLERLTPTA